jgi:hypothetical protein
VVALRGSRCRLDGDQTSPGVAEQEDLLLVKALPQIVGDRERVRDELLDGHRLGRDGRVVGQRSPPLIPPDDGEEVLQVGRVLLGQEVVRHARSAVNPQQHGVVLAPAANDHALLDPV